MEAIISSLATFGVVVILLEIIVKTKNKEIDSKVNKETCEQVQKMHDEKFNVLFDKWDKIFDDIAEIKGDVKLIKKSTNGE